MSGIKNLKEKAKIQLDEMFDYKSVGKPEIQIDEKEEIRKTSQMDIQPNNKPEAQLPSESVVKTDLISTNPHSAPMITQASDRFEIQTQRHAPIYSPKQQSQKPLAYKMTFVLTEEIYKAFNDLYANRILQGRKTEKSEMICEAILLLLQLEEKQTI